MTVRTAGDRPALLIDGARRVRVVEVQDTWRIDDEWWRAPISRQYYRLVLADGSLRTVYHDLVGGEWFAQGY